MKEKKSLNPNKKMKMCNDRRKNKNQSNRAIWKINKWQREGEKRTQGDQGNEERRKKDNIKRKKERGKRNAKNLREE